MGLGSPENNNDSVKTSALETALAGKTILLADDTEFTKIVITKMFSDIKGITVDYTTNGEDAVRKFSENPGLYSFILMDVHMPEKNGLEATRIIRSLNLERAREIPIIALTGSGEEKEINDCFEAGMNDFIEKPMSYETLLSTIAKHYP